MTERLAIIWEGETVGFMQDPVPDMWYLEGEWLPADGPKTDDFLRATRDLDLKKCFKELSGVWVEYVEEGGRPLPAIVMAPPGETIFVRRWFSKDAQGKPLTVTAPKSRWARLWRRLTGG